MIYYIAKSSKFPDKYFCSRRPSQFCGAHPPLDGGPLGGLDQDGGGPVAVDMLLLLRGTAGAAVLLLVALLLLLVVVGNWVVVLLPGVHSERKRGEGFSAMKNLVVVKRLTTWGEAERESSFDN